MLEKDRGVDPDKKERQENTKQEITNDTEEQSKKKKRRGATRTNRKRKTGDQRQAKYIHELDVQLAEAMGEPGKPSEA